MKMENKKDKVKLNDELLDKVAGGDDETEVCSNCYAPLAPGGVCMNPFCPLSNTYTPAYESAINYITENLPLP